MFKWFRRMRRPTRGAIGIIRTCESITTKPKPKK